jgi:SRSO17 transposase
MDEEPERPKISENQLAPDLFADGVGHIERDLGQSGKGYVLGVDAAHEFRSWDKPRRIAGTAANIAKTLQPSDWKRLSAGDGSKGPRLHDWRYLELADLDAEELTKKTMACGHAAC